MFNTIFIQKYKISYFLLDFKKSWFYKIEDKYYMKYKKILSINQQIIKW